ncbi:pyruvate, water dikinase regulatory protein [Acidihalobacter ferrooxydans]|uniref:Putative phosphoenolpyruvate synthase regulatory protein n=1 Tax=Acidihalobacter ferrooxydans TaxID=1765967 RepID=A0A1P8UIK3_9GAMM|nr:pyruvate, water dikinase regulatory protein [Acidihalobacter ferrooxydans]APZ43660.1 phosphoenolpyruvate synthase regulatory protein [Acidihalobacter ferrooxydans]
MQQTRGVFFLSDRTGITAETLGNMLLTQFDGVQFERFTLPFINSRQKAAEAVTRINAYARMAGRAKPLVFSTAVDDDVRVLLQAVDGVFIDFFDAFIARLEKTLGTRASHSIGLAHGINPGTYYRRIEAVNYALAHDDGVSMRNYGNADVILLAPSRCGKTPTCLYLGLQYGIYAANVPLTEEIFESGRLPPEVLAQKSKLYGLTTEAERLSEIRSERLPNSRYASVEQCRQEIYETDCIFRSLGIKALNTARMSVEEIATVILQDMGLKSLAR